MNKAIKYSVLILIVTLSVASCIKDNFDFNRWDGEVQYDASFAAPIAWGDIGFTDVVKMYDSTGLLIDNDEGYVSLQYKTKVKSDKVQDIMFLLDQSAVGNIASPDFNFAGFSAFGDTVSFSYTQNMPITMFNAEAEIDSIILKSGILNITTQSTFKHSAKLYVNFPSVTKNGVPFQKVFTYVAGGGYSSSLNNDYSGYKVDMTQTAANFNEIPIEVKFTLFWSGTTDNSGALSFQTDMVDNKYQIMHGYFGPNQLIFQSDTLDITLFKNQDWEIEDYRFVDPKFKVYYWNSYGVPSDFFFTYLKANSAIDDIEYDILDYGVGLPIGPANPYEVSYATVPNTVMLDSIILNKSNSNIDVVLNKRPRWVQFEAVANTNTAGVNHNNFVTDQSNIEVEVVMELPLWGYVYNFNSRDTADADLSDLFNAYNPVKRALLRIDIQNGFPAEMYGQVYFVDQNYNILDSVFLINEERVLSAADVDANGRVLDYSRKVTKIEYDTERLDKIRNTKYVVYGGQANTTNAGTEQVVKIFSDYRIKFDIGFEVDLEIEGDIDSIINEYSDTTN